MSPHNCAAVAWSASGDLCDILPGRSFEQAAALLGADYNGWLTHDGWAVYYKFLQASHRSAPSICFVGAKTCPGSLSRSRLLPAARACPDRGRLGLTRSLNQEISLHGFWTATGRLEAKLDRLLARPCRDSASRRLAKYCITSGLTSLPSSPAWMRPTMWPSEASELIVARQLARKPHPESSPRPSRSSPAILQTAKPQRRNPFDVVVESLRCSE